MIKVLDKFPLVNDEFLFEGHNFFIINGVVFDEGQNVDLGKKFLFRLPNHYGYNYAYYASNVSANASPQIKYSSQTPVKMTTKDNFLGMLHLNNMTYYMHPNENAALDTVIAKIDNYLNTVTLFEDPATYDYYGIFIYQPTENAIFVSTGKDLKDFVGNSVSGNIIFDKYSISRGGNRIYDIFTNSSISNTTSYMYAVSNVSNNRFFYYDAQINFKEFSFDINTETGVSYTINMFDGFDIYDGDKIYLFDYDNKEYLLFKFKNSIYSLIDGNVNLLSEIFVLPTNNKYLEYRCNPEQIITFENNIVKYNVYNRLTNEYDIIKEEEYPEEVQIVQNDKYGNIYVRTTNALYLTTFELNNEKPSLRWLTDINNITDGTAMFELKIYDIYTNLALDRNVKIEIKTPQHVFSDTKEKIKIDYIPTTGKTFTIDVPNSGTIYIDVFIL